MGNLIQELIKVTYMCCRGPNGSLHNQLQDYANVYVYAISKFACM